VVAVPSQVALLGPGVAAQGVALGANRVDALVARSDGAMLLVSGDDNHSIPNNALGIYPGRLYVRTVFP
jgi:hypothetical protein